MILHLNLKTFINSERVFSLIQKETEQRSIFIDLMKSLLPNFDVKEAQEKLKSLKKTQRDTVDEIKSTRAMLKKMTDEEIPEIPEGSYNQRKMNIRTFYNPVQRMLN